MVKVNCNKQCKYCPITLYGKKGNHIDTGAASKINE